MSSGTTRGQKTRLKPPYVIVNDVTTDSCVKSGMRTIVMHEAQVEEQADGSIVIKGTPAYVYSLDSAVIWVKMLRGDIETK